MHNTFADSKLWFRLQDMRPASEELNGYSICTESEPVDVFYLAPSCLWSWNDSVGKSHRLMDNYDEKQRAVVSRSIALGMRVFSEDCNFYSPFYRQATMDSWFKGADAIEDCFQVSKQDVFDAFDYYMEHLNHGRPYILAGHSQGAFGVVELLKHRMDEERYKKLVAAYAIGCVVTNAEVERYSYLRPATGVNDVGVLIDFNTVSDTNAVSFVLAGNEVCINPVNWRCDTVCGDKSQNICSVMLDKEGAIVKSMPHYTGACIDAKHHVVVVTDISNPEEFYHPNMGELFPVGNFHIYEFNLYYDNLRQNAKERIVAYIDSLSTK